MLKSVKALLMIFVTLSLIACGGEGQNDGNNLSGNPNTNPPATAGVTRNLAGTVAVGAPVAAVLTIVDRRGNTLITESNASGEYSVNLEGRPGPYLIRIQPKDSSLPVMYSFATNTGVANATPFTTLALFLALGNGLEAAFNDWASFADNWDRRDLEPVLAMINANFHNELNNAAVNPLLFDFFTTPFTANNIGFDAFLDEFSASVDFSGDSYSIQNSSGESILLNEKIDTTGYYIGALFTPFEGTAWEFSSNQTINGEQPTSSGNLTVPVASVPWREEHLFGDIWPLYDTFLTRSETRCESIPEAQCDIRVTITRFDNTFDVIGSGGVGTLITGSFNFNWRISGWLKATTGGERQTVDESGGLSHRWNWRRIN